ncbi:MAG TPA: hypothetical protein PLK04_10370 [Bacillota bacterium]|nr:hypothetical protein [Bacillota bacterium]
MSKFYSKVDSDKHLPVVAPKSNFTSGRRDVINGSQFLQFATMNMRKGAISEPHRRIWKVRTASVIAQESWMVIQGSGKAISYDLEHSPVAEVVLFPGDDSFTLEGVRNYLVPDEEMLDCECKTGLYGGRHNGKSFLDSERV